MDLKRRQIIVVSLVLMIIAAGYLNYSYRKNTVNGEFPLARQGERIGDPVYVNNNIEDKTTETGKQDNASKLTDGNNITDVRKGDYFSEARFGKQVAREEEVDRLKNLINELNTSQEEKQKLSSQITKLVSNSDKEMVIEKLIIAKGFEDCVVFINDENVDVVVKSPGLTPQKTAQILDVATRQTKLPVQNLRIIERN